MVSRLCGPGTESKRPSSHAVQAAPYAVSDPRPVGGQFLYRWPVIWDKIRAKTRTLLLGVLIRSVPRTDMVRLGSVYGGWWVPRSVLTEGSICYLAGVGEDVTFDLALIAAVGCDVWAIDPTPRAVAFAGAVTEPKFHFVDVGLWSRDESLRFYEPANPAHVSHSVVNAQRTDHYFEAQCFSVTSLMERLGHDRLDLLKMDIEGAEVEVIRDLLDRGPLPSILCVEFDAPEPVFRTFARVRQLRRAGYSVAKVEGLNATLVMRLAGHG